MQSVKEKEDLDNFLTKVNDLNSVIKDLASNDPSVQAEAIGIADERLKEHERLKQTGFDRTVINKNAYLDDEIKPPGPDFTDQHTSQEAFLTSLEADCRKRSQARKERHRRANAVKVCGNEAFNDGNYEKAIDLYTEATTIAKDLTPLYTNRAAAYIKVGKYKEAIDDCDFALRIDEKWIKSHMFKARSLQNLQNYDEAILEFKEILKIDEKKSTIVKGYIAEVENMKRIHDLENAAKLSLSNEESTVEGIAKVVETLRNRLEEERKTGADLSGSLMYYAGGFRVLQAQLVSELPRTLFRTEGGFKLLTDDGSVSKCLKSLLEDKLVPPHGSDLIAAVLCMSTAACMKTPENLKSLFTEADIPKMFLTFLGWHDDQVKRDAITFFHEASLDERNRIILYENVDCGRLSVLLLKPNTRKADASSASSATLCNLSLDKKFRILVQDDFETDLLPLLQEYMGLVGVDSYEALTLRIRFLNNLSDNLNIASTIASHAQFKQTCLKALERCLDCFKNGMTNPCAMEELVTLLAIIVRRKFDEKFCLKLVCLLCPILMKAKDKELLAKILSLVSLLQTKSCIEMLIAQSGASIVKQLFKFLKQNDIRLKTHSLKIMCCIGQTDPNHLQILSKLDKGYKVVRSILNEDDGDAAKSNQGHIALLLGYLSSLSGGMDPVLEANLQGEVVRRLLVLCRNASNKQVSANCAIALGKLATSDPRFLKELRDHDGINILARHKPDDNLL